MYKRLKLIPTIVLQDYLNTIPSELKYRFDKLVDAEISTESFHFYVSVSSVYSSKIEGEKIELDSFVKYKKFGLEYEPDYTKKIDDLYHAYMFAQQNEMNPETISKVHKLISKNLVSTHWQGKFRNQQMYVTTPDGKIEYVAISPFELQKEMEKFYHDLFILLNMDLKIEEVFYFASIIHLVFVKIHPWIDGNGRTARLLEKWFLAQKLGSKAWYIQSEKMYYEQHETYYHNIRLLGIEYSELSYANSLPFTLMLPASLNR